jgi:hypothetical protein
MSQRPVTMTNLLNLTHTTAFALHSDGTIILSTWLPPIDHLDRLFELPLSESPTNEHG